MRRQRRGICWHRMTSRFMHLGQIIHSTSLSTGSHLLSTAHHSSGILVGSSATVSFNRVTDPLMLHWDGCPEAPGEQETKRHIFKGFSTSRT